MRVSGRTSRGVAGTSGSARGVDPRTVTTPAAALSSRMWLIVTPAPGAVHPTAARPCAVATPRLRFASMGDSDAEARRYHRRQLWLSVAGFLLTAAILLAWLASGAAAALAAALAARIAWRPAVVALMLAAVG